MADLGREGLCVEPGSALGVACLPRWLAAAQPPADAPIVCLLTATGTRWPAELARWDPGQTWVEPTAEAVDRYFAVRGLDGAHQPGAPRNPGVTGMTPDWGQLDTPPVGVGWEFPGEEYRRRVEGARSRGGLRARLPLPDEREEHPLPHRIPHPDLG